MTDRFRPLSDKTLRQMQEAGGYSSMLDTSLDRAARRGLTHIQILGTYGDVDDWVITDVRPRPFRIGPTTINAVDVIARDVKGREFLLGSSMSDDFDYAWRSNSLRARRKRKLAGRS